MRIEVTARHMELTPPIQDYAEKRCDKLVKFFNGVLEFDVVIESERNDFKVEIIADVVGHKDLVAHAKGPDVYACIDEAADKVARQLTDYKEQLRAHH